MIEGLEKAIASIGVAVAAILTPIGVIYTASVNRQNKATEHTIESLKTDVERMEDRLKDLTDSHKAEMAKKDAALLEAKAEAGSEHKAARKWYELCVYWHSTAHEMRRHAQDARQVAESAARALNGPQPVWNATLALPPMTAPTKDEL